MEALNIPVDGFSLNPYVRRLPYQFTPMALDSLNILRRANLYRMRIHAVPDDQNQPLAAYQTQQFQVQVSDGTYLWGIEYNQLNDAWVTVAPVDILFQITEACNGLKLSSEFMGGQGWTSFNAGATLAGGVVPVLLTQPRLFLTPGNINIELSNIGTVPRRCQLLLFFAEPCQVVDNDNGTWGRGN